ncbi:MAG: IscS subfamily cysteine desulfurase, partial [Gammaproteobacteria bacterium]
IAIPGVEGESLRLATEGIAVSAGAACNTNSPEASYVLKALGLSDTLAQGSLRFSVGRFTTVEEIDRAVVLVTKEVARLRALTPVVSDW